MANYTGKMKEIIELYVGREFNPFTEVRMQDDGDGNGPKIVYWDASSLGKSQPTTSQLDALVSDADKVVALNKVHDNRRSEYPEIGEQLDLLYHDIARGEFGKSSGEWAKSIKAVKDKYPKS